MTTAPRRPIPREAAKDELARINDILKEQLVIVGGLAVQQYYEPRNTQDIDLICSFETSTDLITKLYSPVDWQIRNEGTGDDQNTLLLTK